MNFDIETATVMLLLLHHQKCHRMFLLFVFVITITNPLLHSLRLLCNNISSTGFDSTSYTCRCEGKWFVEGAYFWEGCGKCLQCCWRRRCCCWWCLWTVVWIVLVGYYSVRQRLMYRRWKRPSSKRQLNSDANERACSWYCCQCIR